MITRARGPRGWSPSMAKARNAVEIHTNSELDTALLSFPIHITSKIYYQKYEIAL